MFTSKYLSGLHQVPSVCTVHSNNARHKHAGNPKITHLLITQSWRYSTTVRKPLPRKRNVISVCISWSIEQGSFEKCLSQSRSQEGNKRKYMHVPCTVPLHSRRIRHESLTPQTTQAQNVTENRIQKARSLINNNITCWFLGYFVSLCQLHRFITFEYCPVTFLSELQRWNQDGITNPYAYFDGYSRFDGSWDISFTGQCCNVVRFIRIFGIYKFWIILITSKSPTVTPNTFYLMNTNFTSALSNHALCTVSLSFLGNIPFQTCIWTLSLYSKRLILTETNLTFQKEFLCLQKYRWSNTNLFKIRHKSAGSTNVDIRSNASTLHLTSSLLRLDRTLKLNVTDWRFLRLVYMV